PVAEPRLGRRTVLTLPLLPPPQKNRSPPSDSSPETPTPGGISSLSRTSPVCGSIRLSSLSLFSQVPCQSSPSIQVTPVTKRLDSIVRRIAPVSGSTWWILRSRYWPTHSVPSAQVSPESRPPPGAGIVASTRPLFGSIFW